MLLKENLSKGQKITYTKEIMYKGNIEVQTEIFGIYGNKVLMLNGDIFYAI